MIVFQYNKEQHYCVYCNTLNKWNSFSNFNTSIVPQTRGLMKTGRLSEGWRFNRGNTVP